MLRTRVGFWIALLLSSVPATALAQAKPHWTGVFGTPLFLAGAAVLLILRSAFALPGWNRVGIALWHFVVIAGGCLSVYGMQHAAKGDAWHLPAFAASMFVFAVVGELCLRRLRRA